MSQNSTGSVNTSIGTFGMQALASGDANCSIGYDSGKTLVSGSNNTFIGYEADASANNAQDRIALGAGSISTLDNQFALPDNVLNLKLRGTNYVFPATDGTANQALVTNGSGALSWQTNNEPQIIAIPISFEAGEQTTTKTVWYPSSNQYRLSTAYISVIKALAATDAGVIQLNFDTQANILFDSPAFGGVVTIPASTAAGTELIFSNAGNYAQSINTNALARALNLTATKATPGGKVVVTLVFHRV
jgi:hypothetical protein